MSKPKSTQNFHNLPTFLSSFIGREREVAELRQHLVSDRLITLTGAGGSGKTRLAIKVAQEMIDDFEDGIWLVELASINDSALVAQAIASTLDIREESGRSMMNMLMDHLAARQ